MPALRGCAALLTAALLASCSDGAEPGAERTPAGPAAGESSTTVAASPPATPPGPSPKRSRPSKSDHLTPSVTESGPLPRSTFPEPRTLGARWSYAVDPGDAGEGSRGSGTPALERDPAQVTLASVPTGCPHAHRLPRPGHAVEVDYTRARTKVIAIRARFSGPGKASEFFDRRAATISGCRGRSGGQGIGTLVDVVHRPSRGVLLSDRTPRSDPWTELAVLDGAAVVLLAAPGRVDEPPLNQGDVGSLVEAFRR